LNAAQLRGTLPGKPEEWQKDPAAMQQAIGHSQKNRCAHPQDREHPHQALDANVHCHGSRIALPPVTDSAEPYCRRRAFGPNVDNREPRPMRP